LYAAEESSANRAFEAAFARIEALNGIFSDYDLDSEVSRLCDQAPTAAPVTVSRELAEVLAHAQQISQQTDGALDVTVGPITKLWRRARRNYQLPNPDRLREALESVGYRHLVVHRDQRTVELQRPRMRLDFGAIAPGYAADEALRVLVELGIRRALVNASGDITVADPPPGESGWKIDIAPLKPGGPPSRSVWITQASVSTSGDAFQFLEVGGRRYSHIVDPKTGYGLTQRSSVSVIAKSGLDADSLATAVSVMGLERGLKYIDSRPDTAALFVLAEGNGVVTHESSRFTDYCQER
jgi:thiamine biosynthesis lipoprotein